ncbi:cbb3-type cytochrome oxidase assembly protein CcoS [Qipengyuania citrea]|uniref:Cbb3-type cytochrome oxidase assembly protein CcoS n=1 Tax=Qipengyuania citrea TaxID=225971 RepID=A0ABY4U1P9_9SPHN|nr:cbb3-type cytochrome oxidase assembly protein CcoS [Qipengyuania citrea]MAB45470.1 cbb3-type cytochrome oxidase assembly protein CcoS [Sphingomonadaceae bacterium]MBG74785.1 cbb3-type cytochrome oxidase assembly protein CcoS [Erythrobacteraceae bacterium]HAA93371.1 cbb3-type cytochrome oxidase assembly protein CcoS [Rhodospirillaceae bacterium]HCB78606.1 cbb3-type cytochrome oxidase assembly protein CcoS [Erythrobacter sp.]MAQ65629.1 cbb3-type cytochrome oxidase assembly protein CcoS [Sphin
MNVLVFLIPVALFLGGAGLVLFYWAMRNGQFEDLDGAANRILIDEEDEQDGLDVGEERPNS